MSRNFDAGELSAEILIDTSLSLVLYSATAHTPAARVIGTFPLSARRYRLRFLGLGKTPASQAHDIAIGAVTLTPR